MAYLIITVSQDNLSSYIFQPFVSATGGIMFQLCEHGIVA